jgi:hypothetical protein
MKANPRIYHETGREWLADQKAQETCWPVTLQEVEERAAKVTWYPLGHEFKGFVGLTLQRVVESYNSISTRPLIGVIEGESGPDGFPLDMYAFDSTYKQGDVKRAIVYFADSAGHVVPMFSDTFTD